MSGLPFKLSRRGKWWPGSDSGAPSGYLEFAGWLGQGLLWVDGWSTISGEGPEDVIAVFGSEEKKVAAPSFRFPRFDLQEMQGAMGHVAILPIESLSSDAGRLQALYLLYHGEWYRWSTRRGVAIHPNLITRLAEKVSFFEPGVRTALGEFWEELRTTMPSLAAGDPLFERNDALASRLLASLPEPEVAAEESGTVAAGEVVEDGEAELSGVVVLDGEGGDQHADGETVGEAAVEASAGEGELPLDEALEASAVVETPPGEAEGESSVGEDSVGQDAVGEGSVGQDAVGEGSVGQDAVGQDAVGEDTEGSSDEVGAEDGPTDGEPITEGEVPAEGEVGGEDEAAEEEVEEEELPELTPLESFRVDPALPAGLCVDRVLKISSHTIFVKGWIWDAEDVTEDLVLQLPSGGEVSVLDAVARVDRADVAGVYRESFGGHVERRHGFVGLIELDESIEEMRRFWFELRLRDRQPLHAGTLAWTGDPFIARHELLLTLPEPEARLVEPHVHPAVQQIQAVCRDRVSVLRSFAFGDAPASPETTLIVPLGEPFELMEHQLAQLADDPDLAGCELIYVLGVPELEARFEKAAFELSRLYQIPLRGLVLSDDAGYAAAVNSGADAARGRLLMLMHSDVFGVGGGWLRTLTEFHDSRRKPGGEVPGPIGPRLLFEDRSIQHAGFDFVRSLEPDGLWEPRPLLKGFPSGHPAASEPRAVDAVSGACLMIERELFERTGGLRDAYAIGDFEDADLCLRCREEGCESWYVPQAELYHLEGQSRFPGQGWHRNPWTRLYNRWFLSYLWGERLGRPEAEESRE